MELNVKASLVAVLFVVVNVVPVDFALNAYVLVQGQVGEMDGHQRLQVLGVQELAVVGVILHGKPTTDAVVVDPSQLPNVLLSLVLAEDGDDVGLHLEMSVLRNACIGGRRLWLEVDNPVELDNEAGFAFLEAVLAVF